MNEPISSTYISKWIILTLWSIIGGVVHALVEKRNGAIKNFSDGIALALISGFAGLMWGLMAIHFFPNDTVVLAFTSGMGGFMSLEGLVMIINYFKQRFLKE